MDLTVWTTRSIQRHFHRVTNNFTFLLRCVNRIAQLYLWYDKFFPSEFQQIFVVSLVFNTMPADLTDNLTRSSNSSATLKVTNFAISDSVLIFPSIVFNGISFCIFMCNKKLRTPFTIYIMAVLLCNFVFASVRFPVDIVRQLYSKWILKSVLCFINIYFGWTIWGITMYAHALVTVNRLWAMTFPFSYRKHHTKRMALLFCLIIVIAMNAFTLPGVVSDALYYRLPLTTGLCFLDVTYQRVWSFFVVLFVYNLPLFLVVVAFPFICYKQRSRLPFVTVATDVTKAVRIPTKSKLEVSKFLPKSVSRKGLQNSILEYFQITYPKNFHWGTKIVTKMLLL